MDGVKDLVPGIEDPVSVSVEQDGGRIKSEAQLTDQPVDQHSQRRTSSRRVRKPCSPESFASWSSAEAATGCGRSTSANS